MARCEGMDGCDGIQCIEFEKRTNRLHSPLSDSETACQTCQWLRKPKKSHACEHNDKYKTCWMKEEDEHGMVYGIFIRIFNSYSIVGLPKYDSFYVFACVHRRL